MLILSTKLKNAITKKANGMELKFTLKNISVNGQKRGCSGFIRNMANDSVVYVNTEVFGWLTLMYRYADNEQDFKGYHNRWTREINLDELAEAVCKLLMQTPAEANDRRV